MNSKRESLTTCRGCYPSSWSSRYLSHLDVHPIRSGGSTIPPRHRSHLDAHPLGSPIRGFIIPPRHRSHLDAHPIRRLYHPSQGSPIFPRHHSHLDAHPIRRFYHPSQGSLTWMPTPPGGCNIPHRHHSHLDTHPIRIPPRENAHPIRGFSHPSQGSLTSHQGVLPSLPHITLTWMPIPSGGSPNVPEYQSPLASGLYCQNQIAWYSVRA